MLSTVHVMLARMATTKLPGTYRTDSDAKVEFSDALATWVPLAHDELVATARRYHAVITYRELGQHVQEHSGIQTRMLLTNWVGKLLEAVAVRAKANGDPPLTSLCVRQDGTNGTAYAQAPKSTTDEPGEDIELYAARHRLLCYQKFADDLPTGGGRPALTEAEQKRRARNQVDLPPPPQCPQCHTQLPTSGTCDYCS
jgi:hypothetical protein